MTREQILIAALSIAVVLLLVRIENDYWMRRCGVEPQKRGEDQ